MFTSEVTKVTLELYNLRSERTWWDGTFVCKENISDKSKVPKSLDALSTNDCVFVCGGISHHSMQNYCSGFCSINYARSTV